MDSETRTLVCPVCGRGDVADPDPSWAGCPSCDPDAVGPDGEDNVLYLTTRSDWSRWTPIPAVGKEYGWERFPSCDRDSREGGMDNPDPEVWNDDGTLKTPAEMGYV